MPTRARVDACGRSLGPQRGVCPPPEWQAPGTGCPGRPRGSCPGSWLEGLLGPVPDSGSHTHRPSLAASPALNCHPRAEGPRAGPPSKPSPLASPQALRRPARTEMQAPPSTLKAPTLPLAAGKSSAVTPGVSRAGAGCGLKPEASPAKGTRLPSVDVRHGVEVAACGRTDSQPAMGLPLTHPCSGVAEAQRGGGVPLGAHNTGSQAGGPVPTGGQAAKGRLQEGGTGEVQPLPEDSPVPKQPPLQCNLSPCPLPGPSTSPQEGQAEGPAGWRGLLKPVDKKSPAER